MHISTVDREIKPPRKYTCIYPLSSISSLLDTAESTLEVGTVRRSEEGKELMHVDDLSDPRAKYSHHML